LYTSISNGINNNDREAVGLGIGKFLKIFLVVEIPSATESLEIRRIESVVVD